eukprot:NODE_14106_length_348_cov_1.979933_g12944_i0.p4 GENE.NODE_14106_length_348_cov_1.979933_g12944_i0~~NODE_14106_length_348_cov_1.979933_g12944_i0.p4  ORF type:complete len:60 (+),score=1.49 NODE_14106_length_348_cov_1.979933_g12944_i0:162-341(+)
MQNGDGLATASLDSVTETQQGRHHLDWHEMTSQGTESASRGLACFLRLRPCEWNSRSVT